MTINELVWSLLLYQKHSIVSIIKEIGWLTGLGDRFAIGRTVIKKLL